jgi:phage-related protein
VALSEAQQGGTHGTAKLLQGYKGHRVYQASDEFEGDAYRLFYTPQPEAVYVIHAFKKKSTRGIAIPKPDKDLIEQRLKVLDRLRKDQR